MSRRRCRPAVSPGVPQPINGAGIEYKLNISDDFEEFAMNIEKHLHSSIKMTSLRLHYITELREGVIPTQRVPAQNMVNAVLESPSELTGSDSAILLSAMQAGNTEVCKRFLKELSPRQRRSLLQQRVNAKFGASFVQLALEFRNEEVFILLRQYMDLEMKRTVTRSRDNLGNHALHDASLENERSFAISLLSNFSKEERAALIMDQNDKGNNCLRLAASNPSSETLLFYIKKFPTDELLWKAVMMVNNVGASVGHLVAQLPTAPANKMFQALCEKALRLDKGQQFLFQPRCQTTLLHSLFGGDAKTREKELYLLYKLKMLLGLAQKDGCDRELIWQRERDDNGATALYRLAESKNKHHSNAIVEYLLSQMTRDHATDYIMCRHLLTGRTALHAAASSFNAPLIETLIKYIPMKRRMDCFLSTCTKTGSTPLHLAATDSLDTVKMLMKYMTVDERKSNITVEDNYGNTPMLVAFTEGNIDLVNMILKEQWVPRRMMFPLMTARTGFGWTIIHLSCMRLSGDFLTPSVLSFFSHLPGAKLDVFLLHADLNGNTVLHMAALLHRPAVAKSILTEYGKPTTVRKLLQKQNKDGLVASQLCNMPNDVILTYLEPLKWHEWPEAAIIAKRGNKKQKRETQEILRASELKHGFPSTACDEPEEAFEDDLIITLSW